MDDHSSRRIGDVAAATGLSVRTLHHYDDIGLLVAAGRSVAGHRLYSDADVERLSRICLLRNLGLSLADVARILDDDAWDLHATLATHLRQLDARVQAESRLRSRLIGLVAATTPGTDRPSPNELLELLEDMTMLQAAVQRRISILVYRDLEAVFDHLVDVFGLGPGELVRDGDGNVVHGELEVGDGVVWLHPESRDFGLASPSSLGAASATMAVFVDDVDDHHRRAAARGATIVYEPVDQPYGYREYSARDCEGGLWSFMKPIQAAS